MIAMARATYTVPVDDGRKAVEAYKGLTRLMRLRPAKVNFKEHENGCIEQSVSVLRTIVHTTLKGHISLEEHSPMIFQRNDAELISATFVPKCKLPDGPYLIVPVKAGDVLRAQVSPSWVLPDRSQAYERAVSEVVWKSFLDSLCDTPGTLLSRAVTSGADLVSSTVYQTVRNHVDAFMGVYFPTFHARIAGIDQSRHSRNEVRRQMLLELTSRAGVGFRIVLTEFVCLVVARRWDAVKRYLPLMSFLSNHAIIGVRGSEVLVLYA